MPKELILKVDNQEIHLTPELAIPIQQTNIPYQFCRFRTHKPIFWKVELIDYNVESKTSRMSVVDYSVNDIISFKDQKTKREIERIAFEKFDWLKLERNLSSYKKIEMLEVLKEHDADEYFRAVPKEREVPVFSKADMSMSNNEKNPVSETHKVEFTVKFSDAYFMLGYVRFSKRIKEVGGKVDFKISNSHILAEFDNIKSWFARKLKTKRFNVTAIITTTNGNVTDAHATSPQIALIDAKLIDSIKYQRTIALTKPTKFSEVDKSLFTSDEIFDSIKTDDIEGNVFRQGDKDILNFLLDNYKTRNRRQLEYLAGGKQAENSKILFTLNPNFGFLFFIEGEENNHFVWELLNSHATYIWSIGKSEKEIKYQYKRIEASINTIRDIGREQYKRAYRNNHIDNDLVFCVIEHSDISSDFKDGFVKWKHSLNEKIT